ncbi:hypothetical protein HDN1F_29900 [gamma proteobacterium HdN1]|nr:hypothetical protein HDN1F_29900 [gamma proteobacterium HdN1]
MIFVSAWFLVRWRLFNRGFSRCRVVVFLMCHGRKAQCSSPLTQAWLVVFAVPKFCIDWRVVHTSRLRVSGAASCKFLGLHILQTVQANLAAIYRLWYFLSIAYRVVRSGSACAGFVPLTSHNTFTQACVGVAARSRCILSLCNTKCRIWIVRFL